MDRITDIKNLRMNLNNGDKQQTDYTDKQIKSERHEASY